MYSTKEIIANGFITLVNKKRPDKITVIDICRQANVSRETFYYHFVDKYDLFKWIYTQNLIERIHNHSKDNTWPIMIEKIINDAIEYSLLFKSVLGESSIEYSEIIFKTLYEFYYEELSKGQPDGKLPEQIEAEIYIYLKGGIDYFKYYFEKHTDVTYQDVSKLIAGAMPDTLTNLWKEIHKRKEI